MFLTNIDTVVVALFLCSSITLITLLGILILFRFKYKESKLLLSFFFRLVGILFVSIIVFLSTLLFKWPNLTDILICGVLNIFELWFYFRLFTVFRQFINIPLILTYVILIILNFVIFTIQVAIDNNLFLFLSAFLSFLIVINLHFLVLSILIKFEGNSS